MDASLVGGAGFAGSVSARTLAERDHAAAVRSRSPERSDLPVEMERIAGYVAGYDSENTADDEAADADPSAAR